MKLPDAHIWTRAALSLNDQGEHNFAILSNEQSRKTYYQYFYESIQMQSICIQDVNTAQEQVIHKHIGFLEGYM